MVLAVLTASGGASKRKTCVGQAATQRPQRAHRDKKVSSGSEPGGRNGVAARTRALQRRTAPNVAAAQAKTTSVRKKRRRGGSTLKFLSFLTSPSGAFSGAVASSQGGVGISDWKFGGILAFLTSPSGAFSGAVASLQGGFLILDWGVEGILAFLTSPSGAFSGAVASSQGCFSILDWGFGGILAFLTEFRRRKIRPKPKKQTSCNAPQGQM